MNNLECNNIKLGFHTNKEKSYYNTIKINYETNESNSFQIFIGSPKSYKRPELDINNNDVIKTQKYIKDNNIFLVSHSPYLYNIANELGENEKTLDAIIADINNIVKLGGIGTVVHVGKHLHRDEEKCVLNMYNSIKFAIKNTESGFFILETPAGCGTELCKTIEELADLYDKFNEEEKKRVKLCVDTCHIFSAGYDLNTIESVNEYIENFDNFIGWKNVCVIHFNNSMKECGCGVDRHDNIKNGKINEIGLIHFAKKMIQFNIPLILETPLNIPRKDEIIYLKNLLH